MPEGSGRAGTSTGAGLTPERVGATGEAGTSGGGGGAADTERRTWGAGESIAQREVVEMAGEAPVTGAGQAQRAAASQQAASPAN
jgi:hypothetical protein